jgi:transcriptional regulator with XRE-family HTH domain
MAHLPTPPPQTARAWVGRNVRRYREEQGLNIGQLAERVSELGFPLERTQLSKIENGRTNVDVEKLLALATALDVLPDRLLRDPDELDAAIFDRLLSRWTELVLESVIAEARSSALIYELEKMSERSPDLRTKFDEQIEKLGRMTVSAVGAEVEYSSTDYDDYLDELLLGPEVEFRVRDEEPKAKKGGK